MRKGAQQGANPLISHMAELSRPRRALASFVPFWFLSPMYYWIYTTCLFFSLYFFHYVMMMNMNIKARQPRRQYEPSHTASSSSPFYYVGQAVGVLHHVPLEKHGPFGRFVFVVKSVLDWLSGTRESFWPYSFWTSRLWYSAAMPIRILLHVFLGWILLCLAIKREIIGDF